MPPLPWGLHDYSEGELFTQEVRLQSRGDQPLQWIVGAYYLDQEAKFSQFVPDYSCPACLGQVARGQNFELDAPLAKFYENEQKSIFAQVSYDITEQWTVGRRRSLPGRRHHRLRHRGGRLPDPRHRAGPHDSGAAAERSRVLRSILPLTCASSRATRMTLYAQAAKGFRSGVVNPLIADTCQEQAQALGAKEFTDPDTLWNYELGAKSQLADGRLAINGAVYRQKWEGVQLGVTLECGFSQVLNAGDATSDGVELELVAQPVDAWRFNLSVLRSTTPSSTTSYPESRLPPRRASARGAEGQRQRRRAVQLQPGQHLVGIRARGLRARRRSSREVPDAGPGGLQRHRSRRTPSTRRICASSFQRGPLGLDLFGNNLFDERGVVNTGQPSFGSRENITRPREVGVELRYSF